MCTHCCRCDEGRPKSELVNIVPEMASWGGFKEMSEVRQRISCTPSRVMNVMRFAFLSCRHLSCVPLCVVEVACAGRRTGTQEWWCKDWLEYDFNDRIEKLMEFIASRPERVSIEAAHSAPAGNETYVTSAEPQPTQPRDPLARMSL